MWRTNQKENKVSPGRRWKEKCRCTGEGKNTCFRISFVLIIRLCYTYLFSDSLAPSWILNFFVVKCWILLKSKLLTFFFQVKEALFQCFLDVRGSFKTHLLLSIFVSQAKELYRRWITHQEGEIPLEKQLKFSKIWIKGWMNEYRVSLNKRYTISATDRKDRIIELLKNVWRLRYWFSSKFGKEITVINGDQIVIVQRWNNVSPLPFTSQKKEENSKFIGKQLWEIMHDLEGKISYLVAWI